MTQKEAPESHVYGVKQPKPSTQKWRQGRTTGPGLMGIMTNFDCINKLSTLWSSFNDKKEYTDPLLKQCKCGNNHKAETQKRTKTTHPATCAETLLALPRVPEGHGELNRTSGRGSVNHIFSVLADTDRQSSC